MILKRLLVSLIVLSFVFTATRYSAKPAVAKAGTAMPTLESVQKTLQAHNGFFIENKGQWNPHILYMGDTSFGRIAFTKQAVFYELSPKDPTQEKSHVVELAFQNSLTPTIQGLEPKSFYTNYFIGNDSTKWATHCKTYRSVTYKNIWDGIDMAYFFTPEGLKYEYYIHPGADTTDLQVKLIGATPETVDSSRYLEYVTPLGSLKDYQLKVFTQTTKQPIDASFSVQDDILSFTLENIKRTETIVVDPLLYSTILGSTGMDWGKALVTDPQGNTLLVGTTPNNDFPMNATIGGTLAPGYDKDFNGVGQDIFLVKLNPEGTELLYATYLGGSIGNDGTSIAIDALGCAYVVGTSSSTDFPMTQTIGGASIPGYNQTSGYGFIVKLNQSGTELLYATFLGGTQPKDVEVDPFGFTYIAGSITSDSLPKTITVGGAAAPGYDQIYNGPGDPFGDDAFALKLNPQGTEIVYSTYLGGLKKEQGMAISYDNLGNAYVGGSTQSSDFPMNTTVGGTQAPGYNHTYNGGDDCFVVKLNPQGTELLYSSYFGGNRHETLFSMDIDFAGNIYAVGRTWSKDFPMTTTVGGSPAPGFDKEKTGGDSSSNGFIFKVNNIGTELIYSSYFGEDFSYIKSVKVDASGNAWFLGQSTDNYPAPMTATLGGGTIPGYDQVQEADEGVFLSQLNPQGTELRYSSFFSGAVYNAIWYGKLIGLDNSGNVYFTALTQSSDFPSTTEVGGDPAPGYNHSHNGSFDAVVAKIGNPYPGFTVTASVTSGMGTVSPASQVVQPGDNATITITPAVGYRIATITDNGQTKTVVTPYVINNVTENHIVEVAFVVGSDKPELKIWAEVNKPTFNSGDTIMIMVTIANQGNGPASATKVTMTLPQELGFLRATRYRSIVKNSQIIEFDVGAFPENSIQKFQVDASVNVDVTHTRSLPIFFDITCTEKSSDSTYVMIMLESKKTGDSSMYLSLYFRNAQWDPITSTVYIPMDTPLELIFSLSGGKLPYNLFINWGEGATENLVQQSENNLTLKHQFSSKGKMTMKFQVTDNLQQTRTATISIEVR